MAKYRTAFFMAWGNFFALPCPNKKWDENQRRLMLVFFPVIGLIIGMIWVLLWWVLDMLPVPPSLMAAVLVIYPFMISGYIHLDGFMDCNDAILSRKPLEERQKILKDSHVGAFAVISAIILFVLTFGAMVSEMDFSAGFTGVGRYDMLALISVPVISRSLSARAVLVKRPLGHSQYSAFDAKANKKYAYAVIVMAVVAISIPLAVLGFGPQFVFGETEAFKLVQALSAIFCCTVAAHFIALDYGDEQLGGMSGDISGYALTIAEAAAVITLAIV